MTGVSGALAILAAAAALGAYLLLVGAGVRIVVARWWAPIWPLGLTMAVGAATSSVLVALAYRLLDAATLPVVPLGVVAAVVVAVNLIRSVRARSSPERSPDRRSLLRRWVTATDWAAAGLATFVLLPLLRYGPTFWTSWVNDFISYAASAQVWMGTSGAAGVDFASAHPDWFGAGELSRANHEKPMMTALLVVASRATRLPAFQLLVPVMLVMLFVLASTIMRLVQVRFSLSSVTAALVTALPFLSVVPLSRVYDAQLGQVGSAALLGALLLLVVLEHPESRGAMVAAGVVSGLVLAAAIGSNATLVVGSAVALAGIYWWLVSSDPRERRARVGAGAVALMIGGALCVPFASWFAASLADQTGGAQGFDIALLTPWAVLGQQPALNTTPGTRATLVAWAVVAALLLVALVVRIRATGWASRYSAGLVMVVAVGLNVWLVVARTGWTNYSLHKLTALLVVLLGPCALGLLASWAPERARRWVVGVAAVLAVSAGVIAWNASSTVVFVMPPELVALQDSEVLGDIDRLNLLLVEHGEAGFGSLLVPSKAAYVTFAPFTPTDPAFDGSYLMRSVDVPVDPGWIATPLNDLYTVVRFDQTVTKPVTAFTSGAPASRRHLFGSWYPAEAWGTWSGSKTSTVVLRVPAALRSRDVELVVTGAAFSDPAHPRTVTYVVNGTTRASEMFTTPDQRGVVVRVPASVVTAADGRLQLDLVNPEPIQPAAIGGVDTRVFSFAISTIEVRAASRL